MKYLVKFIVVTFFLLICTHTFAEQKIVVLDLKFVLNNSKAGKDAQDFLQKSLNDSVKKYSDMEKELKKEEIDLLAKKTVLSREEYTKRSDSLRKNFEKILVLIMPILPHFASECLTMLNPKLNLENISWPVYDKVLMEDSDCNIVIQINGKKRSLIRLPINSDENFVIEKAKLESNIKKYLINNNIKKQIYVKNRLINFII